MQSVGFPIFTQFLVVHVMHQSLKMLSVSLLSMVIRILRNSSNKKHSCNIIKKRYPFFSLSSLATHINNPLWVSGMVSGLVSGLVCGLVCGVIWCGLVCGVICCGLVCGLVCGVIWCVVWCVVWCDLVHLQYLNFDSSTRNTVS
jgi:hypothetical protein